MFCHYEINGCKLDKVAAYNRAQRVELGRGVSGDIHVVKQQAKTEISSEKNHCTHV